MHRLTLALLTLHITLGTAAIVAGLCALVTTKGGRRHRRGGALFVRSMQVVIGSAVVLTMLHADAYFAGLTAAAAVATFSGARVLRRKRPDLDPRQRATPLDWGVTLILAAVSGGLLASLVTGRVTAHVAALYPMTSVTLAYAVYDLRRFARPAGWPFGPNLWLYEHIVKMTGAYFGAVAAFSGSVLRFLDPPWRQLWATTLGQLVAIAFVVATYRRLNGSRRRAARPDAAGCAAERPALP